MCALQVAFFIGKNFISISLSLSDLPCTHPVEALSATIKLEENRQIFPIKSRVGLKFALVNCEKGVIADFKDENWIFHHHLKYI